MTLKKDFYYPEICPVSISSLKKKYCKDKHTPRKKNVIIGILEFLS